MQPIEVLAWGKMDGTLQPLRFRIVNKDGSVTEVSIDTILSQSEDRLAANHMITYVCKGEVAGKLRQFELKFEVNKCKWYLYRI